MSADFMETANRFLKLCKRPTSRSTVLMKHIVDHFNVALVILDFDEDNSISQKRNDVRFATTFSADDLIDTG